MTTENTYFDRRYTTKPGFAPPSFPSTLVSANNIQNAMAPLVTTPPPQRMSWVTTPQQFALPLFCSWLSLLGSRPL